MYQKDGELYYQVRYIANNHTVAQLFCLNHKDNRSHHKSVG